MRSEIVKRVAKTSRGVTLSLFSEHATSFAEHLREASWHTILKVLQDGVVATADRRKYRKDLKGITPHVDRQAILAFLRHKLRKKGVDLEGGWAADENQVHWLWNELSEENAYLY